MKAARSAATIMSITLASGALAQIVQVFPDLPHAASNAIPFGFTAGNTGITVHQVFAASQFAAATGGQPAVISKLALAPTGSGTFSGHLVIRLGYTDRIPGQLPPTGLDLPDLAGGGAPNATGPMHTFYSAHTIYTVVAPNSENFQFMFEGNTFSYDPAQGNLLMEIVVTDQLSGISVSRSEGSALASRSYRRQNNSTSLTTTQAHRTQFTFTAGGACYANCDGSTTAPVLNVADFSCFLSKFAANDPYANCDGSTTAPVLNVADFSCFLSKFAAGCP